jgi:hypothetical protein
MEKMRVLGMKNPRNMKKGSAFAMDKGRPMGGNGIIKVHRLLFGVLFILAQRVSNKESTSLIVMNFRC